MCGISGATGAEKAGQIAFDGLKKLEYRGYDSFGVAMRTGSGIHTYKKEGKISDSKFKPMQTTEAIGHSRWATHGEVNQVNSHPHSQGSVTLVHNGTVTNYVALKRALEKEGYEFISETDSEIVAALLDEYIQEGKTPKQAIIAASSQIQGDNSFVFMIDGQEGIWAFNLGRPIRVGIADGVSYIGSDVQAFLEHTNIVNYLDKGDACYLHQEDRKYFSCYDGKEIKKEDISIDIEPSSVEKGNYAHFMQKEIFEQTSSINVSLDQDSVKMSMASDLIKYADRVFIIGSGTSHKVAMVAEYWLAKNGRIYARACASTELSSWMQFIGNESLVIAISQSGETADVISAVRGAQERGASVLALTNIARSELDEISDVTIPLQVGIEKAVASTKATTAQMAIMYQLAKMVDNELGEGLINLVDLSSGLSEQLNPNYIKHVEDMADVILKQLGYTENGNGDQIQKNSMIIIGRDILYPIALESAIKIQEVSYIHAQGFAAGELKHGPLALIEKGIPCIVLGDDDRTINEAVKARARGACILGISAQKHEVFDHWLSVPNRHDVYAIATLIPMQLLSYFLAIKQGRDPDFPRNLAKAVTVE